MTECKGDKAGRHNWVLYQWGARGYMDDSVDGANSTGFTRKVWCPNCNTIAEAPEIEDEPEVAGEIPYNLREFLQRDDEEE